MDRQIHPKARDIFFELSLVGPLRKFFFPPNIDIDMTNNTNAFMGTYAQYPDPMQFLLKEQYWDVISSLNKPSDYGQDSLSAPPEWGKNPPIHEHILFTLGSSEGIDLLLRTFAEPNKDKIVVTVPSFSAYEHWGRIHNLHIEKIPLQGESYESFSIEDVVRVNPKLIFLCQPNNPTGTVLKQELIHELCQHPKLDGFVVVDEAYMEFAKIPSMIHDLHRYKNLIVLRTLSKAWGLAGVRCGAILADPFVIYTLRHIQVPFGFPEPSQKIVKERCLFPQSMIPSWEKILRERTALVKELELLPNVERVLDSQTNFLLVILRDHGRAMDKLMEHHIYVGDYNHVVERSIRVTVGTEEENKKFLEVMALV